MSPSKAPANDRSAADSFNQVCTVRIDVLDTGPLIWREVEVPTSITLKVLHDVVQITMGWLDQHLWEFKVGSRIYGLPMGKDWAAHPASRQSGYGCATCSSLTGRPSTTSTISVTAGSIG